MDWPLLPLFPPGALSGSVVVTVWVGVLVVATTNLRLGWVLSGLVVPGYMVPLLIAKPLSATVVFAEGIVTYALVWFYSEYLTRHNGWSSFFGRDRFFALVLASVGVRLVADGWLLPMAGAWLEQEYALAFDYRNDLHSFGLIVVSLIANNFWKTGLVRGVLPMAVQVGITWLIVRYGLMSTTNFNIESTALLYEDIASSMLASPKAYIILIVTAFIASRLNLFYGWDFSGILIPSLLALQWFEPLKIAATFAEALIVLGLSILVLRLPVFRSITIEGSRKIMLFFSVSFCYKLALGWALWWSALDTKISDWYGFGYLLATLIALKVHDKGILARLTQATLQTSLAGVMVATGIGFALLLVPDAGPARRADGNAAALAPRQLQQPLVEVLLERKTAFYRTRLGETTVQPLPSELNAFAQGVRALQAYRISREPDLLQSAQLALAEARYELLRVGEYHLLLEEREPKRHWGLYVVSLVPEARLVVEVPAPLDESGSYEIAIALMDALDARGLASGGGARRVNPDRSADVLTAPQTIYQTFHREMATGQVLQVRGTDGGLPQLHVSGGLPEGVNFNRVQQAGDGRALMVSFAAASGRNLQRETSSGSFVEARLSPPGPVPRRAEDEPPGRPVAAEVLALINPTTVAVAGSEAYRRSGRDELLRLDAEVLSPMMAAALGGGEAALPSVVARVASALGLRLWTHRDATGRYLLLHDPSGHRGLVVLRVGSAREVVVELPRPVVERGTLEAGVAHFNALRARALVITAAAPDANADHSADVLDAANPGTLFQLAHQVLLRELDQRPGAALQVRAMGVRPDQPPPTTEALLAWDQASADRSRLTGIVADVTAALESTGLPLQLGTGADARTAGYEVSAGPQAAYMKQTYRKRLAVLWLSPLARASLGEEALSPQRLAFDALGIPSSRRDVAAWLTGRRVVTTVLPTAARDAAQRYLDSGDIVALTALQRSLPGWQLERVEDDAGRGAFLSFAPPGQGALAAVFAMSLPRSQQATRVVPPGTLTEATVDGFLSQRVRWMVAR